MPSKSPAQARVKAKYSTPLSDSQRKALGSACAEALERYRAKATRMHPDDRRKKHLLWAANEAIKVRNEMVSAYGGKCIKCGELDPIVLVLDHLNDDGAQQRKTTGIKGGWILYVKLRKLGWPKEDFQLLCHNCNFKKEYLRRKNAVR